MKGVWGWLIALCAVVAIFIFANQSPPVQPTTLGAQPLPAPPAPTPRNPVWDARLDAARTSATASSWETLTSQSAADASFMAVEALSYFEPDVLRRDFAADTDRVLDMVYAVATSLDLDPVELLTALRDTSSVSAEAGETLENTLALLAGMAAALRQPRTTP